MRITDPLNSILNNATKVKILRFLATTGARWSGRQIARQIGSSPTTTHKALQQLQGEGVLLLDNIGKTHVYTLDRTNRIVADMLSPLFDRENKILKDIVGAIKKGILSSGVKKAVVSVGIFGSVKKRKDRAASDIDLFVIIDNAKNRSAVEKAFEKIGGGILKRYGKVVAPYMNTKAEFKAKHGGGLPVVKNIVRSHDVIYGKDPGSMV